MLPTLRHGTILSACLLLAACSGGSSDRDAPEQGQTGGPSYEGYYGRADGLIGKYFDTEATASLPTSGSATYRGAVVTNYAAGRLALASDFASDRISGDVTRLVDTDDRPIEGRILISNGTIDRAADPNFEPVFVADLDGTVRDVDGYSYSIDGSMEGVFAGAGAEAVGGAVGGDVYLNGSLYDQLEGGFIAER